MFKDSVHETFDEISLKLKELALSIANKITFILLYLTGDERTE